MFSKKKKVVLSFLTCLLFFILDRLLKNLYFLRPRINWLNFQENYNFLFIFQGWLFYLLTVLILLILAYWVAISWRNERYQLVFALALILVGGFSNFFDRLLYGFVIDYFYFFNLWFFNLADLMILFGVLVLLFDVFRKKEPCC